MQRPRQPKTSPRRRAVVLGECSELESKGCGTLEASGWTSMQQQLGQQAQVETMHTEICLQRLHILKCDPNIVPHMKKKKKKKSACKRLGVQKARGCVMKHAVAHKGAFHGG